MSKLWEGCLICDNKCCKRDIAYPLFVTQEEMERIEKLYPGMANSFNKALPCLFLSEDGLCKIHEDKPVDCRLFPFDIMEIDGKLCWIVWKVDCPILQEPERFDEYIDDLEKRLIPGFAPWLKPYALFRFDELTSKYGFEILREVRVIGAEGDSLS